MHATELSTLDEMLGAFPVLSQMYPNLTYAEYAAIMPERHGTGYRMVAVFDGEACVACAGFWIGFRFYSGRFLQLDNLVVDKNTRSKGAGKALIDWIKNLAQVSDCKKVILDSYVENFDAHRFFFREGFVIRGYHFNYSL